MAAGPPPQGHSRLQHRAKASSASSHAAAASPQRPDRCAAPARTGALRCNAPAHGDAHLFSSGLRCAAGACAHGAGHTALLSTKPASLAQARSQRPAVASCARDMNQVHLCVAGLHRAAPAAAALGGSSNKHPGVRVCAFAATAQAAALHMCTATSPLPPLPHQRCRLLPLACCRACTALVQQRTRDKTACTRALSAPSCAQVCMWRQWRCVHQHSMFVRV